MKYLTAALAAVLAACTAFPVSAQAIEGTVGIEIEQPDERTDGTPLGPVEHYRIVCGDDGDVLDATFDGTSATFEGVAASQGQSYGCEVWGVDAYDIETERATGTLVVPSLAPGVAPSIIELSISISITIN